MVTATAAPTTEAPTKEEASTSQGSKRPYRSYKELIVWQRAVDLVTAVYEVTQSLPEEYQNLTAKMREDATSIATLIASGKSRGSRSDYLFSLRAAHGDGSELETRAMILTRLPLTKDINIESIETPLTEVLKMLGAMIRKMNERVDKEFEQELKAFDEDSESQE